MLTSASLGPKLLTFSFGGWGDQTVSGNVSLYNETESNSIMPTPTIGAVGIIENIKDVIHIQIKEKETLFLVGNNSAH